MSIENILMLLGGLSLFLYGMQMMSFGLEGAAGDKMKQILEKLTSNRFLGVAVSAGITCVIQSSSAVTVMVVGFVNSGMMTLNQAVWIIMGANIGTTITGQLIALDIGALAPLFAFIGVAMIVFVKNQKAHHLGEILAGFGILFMGMGMISDAMMPLRDSPAFVNIITTFSSPIPGILAGAVFTALIQSSSASVGVLQALANSGLIGLSGAVYVLFGQNIGTCITAALASIGTNRNAKRTTIIHLMFNIIGTVIFTFICILTPLTAFVSSLTPLNASAQIANMHTIFNVATTIMLIPFGNTLAKIAIKLLPEKPEETIPGKSLVYIKAVHNMHEYSLGSSAIYIGQLNQEIKRMTAYARENVMDCFASIAKQDLALMHKVAEREEYIDYLNKEISQFISKIISIEGNQRDSEIISSCFKIVGNIERIGDHALNICEYTQFMYDKQMHFSEEAKKEIINMQNISVVAMDYLLAENRGSNQWVNEISDMEQQIDDMTTSYRDNQIRRMKESKCSEETCILYSEMLTDFERIGDHILNIAVETSRILDKVKIKSTVK